MNLFEHTLYINLDSRTDRRDHAEEEFKKMNITAERVSGTKMANGAVGCTLSHIKCLELAKKRKYSHVFICEDDIHFTNAEVLKTNVAKFITNCDFTWNMLIIGGNNVPPYITLNDYSVRIFECQTTTGYVVHENYYNTLIANFKESANKLMRTSNNKMYSLDIYWKRLQKQDFWFMIIPPTVTQYESYSDIEERVVNYDRLMLDMDKEWLMQRLQMQKMQFNS